MGFGKRVTDWQSGTSPPLDPSTVLRVSGPSLGMDPGSGAGMTGGLG